MKKNILKIIIITLLFFPFISQAFLVSTGDVIDITDTTATLRGGAGLYIDGCYGVLGYSSKTGLPCNTPITPITAYFRYSKSTIAPIFCNDIYGTNMIATKDINLGDAVQNIVNFTYQINNLTPNTTYYYCAIISNENNIIYAGGEGAVKQFHTNPLKTTITTTEATHISSTTATINGSYSATKDVTTYFEYKEDTTTSISFFETIKKYIAEKIINTVSAFDGVIQPWKKVGEQSHSIGNYSNLYGNLSFSLTGLKPNTRYIFRAVANDNEIFFGNTLNFTTNISTDTGNGGGSIETESCSAGWTGIYPNCDPPAIIDVEFCPTGWIGTPPSCVEEAQTINFCPVGWEGVWPTCIGPGTIGTCPTGFVGTYPVCVEEAQTINFCPVGWEGVWPTCIDPGTSGVCPIAWTGIWPNCIAPGGIIIEPGEGGIGISGGGGIIVNGGGGGIWNFGTGTGNWNTNTGIGGIGIANWTQTGTGTGIWTSGTGTGTWTITNGTVDDTIGTWTEGIGNGTWQNNQTPTLVLGQIATPPSLAIVRYHEGIETVFTKQIMADITFAKLYGYVEGNNLETFAWNLSDQLAKMFGYVGTDGKEIRVSLPDVAAYQLQLIGNKLTVYEYYNNKIIDIRNTTTDFKNASEYEYYFKK